MHFIFFYCLVFQKMYFVIIGTTLYYLRIKTIKFSILIVLTVLRCIYGLFKKNKTFLMTLHALTVNQTCEYLPHIIYRYAFYLFISPNYYYSTKKLKLNILLTGLNNFIFFITVLQLLVIFLRKTKHFKRFYLLVEYK